MYNITHLLYNMDDIKLYAPSRRNMTQLLDIERMFSRDIHMAFGLDKYRIMEINGGRGNGHGTDQIEENPYLLAEEI